MAVCHLEFGSVSLGMRTRVNVILPDYPNDPKVLLLLHGLGDDENSWLEQSRLISYSTNRQLCILMPRVDRSYYTNTMCQVNYFDYVADELLKRCCCWFGITPTRSKTFVGGISMGGYGALKLALNRPNIFSESFVLSGVTDLGKQWDNNLERNPWYSALFGSRQQFEKSNSDLHFITTHWSKNVDRPRIRQICGQADPFYSMNVEYQKIAVSNGFDAHLKTVPGGHQWNVWDSAIQTVLESIDAEIK